MCRYTRGKSNLPVSGVHVPKVARPSLAIFALLTNKFVRVRLNRCELQVLGHRARQRSWKRLYSQDSKIASARLAACFGFARFIPEPFGDGNRRFRPRSAFVEMQLAVFSSTVY